MTSDTPDPDALEPHTYHRVVGPPLRAAAETAARRGHKHLFDDMPAMLALIDMVTRLADLYGTHYPQPARRQARLLEHAASAACVMVFQEASLSPDAIDSCLAALESAYAQAQEHGVIDAGARYVAMAWSHLEDDDRDAARHCLSQAAGDTIGAIEAWRRDTH